jgi:hypothetical protein
MIELLTTPITKYLIPETTESLSLDNMAIAYIAAELIPQDAKNIGIVSEADR